MDVPELVPMDDYDPEKAKLLASMKWVIAKAYGTSTPPDYKEPFYDNQQGELSLKPAVINGLTSSDVYCRACTNLFQDSSSQWKSHSNVIQALSRKGIYVMDPKESAVTETTLMQTSPFKLYSHLALIDCLMKACYTEMVTVERVVQAVRKFISFNASSELPYDTEDALMFWINKVCVTTQHQFGKVWELCKGLDSAQKTQLQKARRFPIEPVHIPLMDDLLKDINDGCCLATLVYFYCPNNFKLIDATLSDGPGIADSMQNLQLVLEFCKRYLPVSTAAMTLNDLFYTSEELKENLLVLLAEIFCWFEVKPLKGIRDTSKPLILLPENTKSEEQGKEDETPKPKSSAGRPPVPISNATKRSFQQNPTPRPGDLGTTSASSTPDLHNASPSPTVSHNRQALLPRRSQQPRNSLQDGDASLQSDDAPRQSVQAWEDKQQTQQLDGNSARSSARSSVQSGLTDITDMSQGGSSQLLANVSMDTTDASLDFTVDGSIDISDIDTPRANPHSNPGSATQRLPSSSQRATNLTDPTHPDYLELQSVTSRAESSQMARTAADTARSVEKPEPLMPAQVKPSKEKAYQHTKEVERGDVPEKTSPASPAKPRTLNFAAARGIPNTGGEGDSSGSSTPDEEYKTPSVESMPLPGEVQLRTGAQSQGIVRSSQPQASQSLPSQSQPSQSQARQSQPNQSQARPAQLNQSQTRPAQPNQSQARQSQPNQSQPNQSQAKQSQPNQSQARPAQLNQSQTRPAQPNQSQARQSQPNQSQARPPAQTSQSKARSSQPQVNQSQSRATPTRTNNYESFYVDTTDDPHNSLAGTSFDRTKSTAQSFIVKDHPHTPDSARAAGIPVIDDNARHHESRSSRDHSSSESSDQELKKIYADHRERESQDSFVWGSERPTADFVDFARPGSLNLKKPIVVQSTVSEEKSSPKTSFAEIKKQKENGEVSPVTFATNGTSGGSPYGRGALQQQLEKQKVGGKTTKKTSFAALPNQTTWQETANKSPTKDSNKETDEAMIGVPAPSELISIRMQLEEKRRQIENEKRKMEMQWNKQRQRVGKQAFIQVISKGKGEKTSEEALKSDPKVLETVEELSPDVAARGKPEAVTTNLAPKPEQQKVSAPEPIKIQKPDPVLEEPDPVREGEPSPPAPSRPRGHSVDRVLDSERTKSSADKLDQEFRTSTPPPQSRRDSDRDVSPKPTRSFSREDIQEKIDNVRNKWFPETKETNSEKEKVVETKQTPMESLDQGTVPAAMVASQERPRKGSSGAGLDNAGEYNKSLDKLNSSLSELQGEIMRLSFQQDQIKNLVHDDARKTPTPPVTIATQAATTARQHPEHDQFYLAARKPGGEPDIAGAPLLPTTQPAVPPYSTQGTMPVQYSQPYAPQLPAPPYAAPPGQYPPHQYMPTQQPHLPPMGYPSMQQYPSLAPQYQGAPPMYGQPPMYQYPNLQNQWQQQPPQPPYPGPITSSLNLTSQPLMGSHLSPAHLADTQTVSAHSSYSPSTHTDSHLSDLSSSFQQTSSPSNKTPTTPLTVQSPPRGSSPSSHNSHSPVASPKSKEGGGGQAWLARTPEDYVPPPIEPQEPLEQATSPTQANAGFFISFDDTPAPTKRKPKLKSQDKRKADLAAASPRPPSQQSSPAVGPQTPNGNGPGTTPAHPGAGPAAPTVTPPVNLSPGVGFVIGEAETTVSTTEMSEMEKRKRKILEQQLKRKADIEQKRLQKEAERNRKRDKQRMKQEEAEQKKEEEKAKRDAIFQQYIQKKAEREAAEETSRAGMAPVKKRQHRRPQPVRPKSQPPQASNHAGDQDKHSASSHSSQEELRERRGHGGHGDEADGFQLAYGGLTHRRPPSPEKSMRAPSAPPPLLPQPPLGDAFVPSEVHLANNPTEYSGPKLYVKPSQKSNRNIIMNAISHCCLAGTVNTDTKNRVLEEISRSEEKHFVILFRDAFMQYRGIYAYNPEKEEVVKVHGVGPKVLMEKFMDRFYKYNSGTKSFIQISTTKHMSATIDAITIQSSLWQKKKKEKEKPSPMY